MGQSTKKVKFYLFWDGNNGYGYDQDNAQLAVDDGRNAEEILRDHWGLDKNEPVHFDDKELGYHHGTLAEIIAEIFEVNSQYNGEVDALKIIKKITLPDHWNF